ncbi:MAG: oligosaccharide flippase family protein [Bacteroidales bacterium]|nr:oligosaccharide flippase family protein [Bacteroidales bacterium]
MNPIKRLAGQTAIYGLPFIVSRILFYLLVPLYTRLFLPGEYGTVSVFYSYTALLMVFLTYGMETAFFRYLQEEKDKNKVFSTSFLSLIFSTLLFLVLSIGFSRTIAVWIQYPDNQIYVIWFALIIGFDILTTIPFAKLRALNRPIRFAYLKVINVSAAVFFNLFFLLLCPYLLRTTSSETIAGAVRFIYNPEWGIEYIFIANLIASALTFLLLIPEMTGFKLVFDRILWRRMFVYAFPLLFAGLAGIINETFDRILLRYLLPADIAEAEVGIYSACYKIAILMTIFITAYRYAADPFFFSYYKEKDAKVTYARVMNYFVIAVSVIFLTTMLYLDDVILPLLIGEKYHSGKAVIPILMLAHLFLGIYYNLSIWYKLTGQTNYGAWLGIFGAVITVGLNVLWIPRSPDHYLSGYMGSAWATFIGYGIMLVLSYFLGQKYYRIPYQLNRIFTYLGVAIALYYLTVFIHPETAFIRIAFHSLLLILYLLLVAFMERKDMVSLWASIRRKNG